MHAYCGSKYAWYRYYRYNYAKGIIKMNSIFKKVLIIISIPVFVVMALVVIHDTVTPDIKDPVATIQPLTPEQEKEMAIAAEGAALAVQQAYDNSVHSSNATVERLLNSVRSRCGKNDLESLKLTAEIMMLRGHVIESDLNKFPDCVTQ
jgi:hypothetical protein